jgi:hypothetical protein
MGSQPFERNRFIEEVGAVWNGGVREISNVISGERSIWVRDDGCLSHLLILTRIVNVIAKAIHIISESVGLVDGNFVGHLCTLPLNVDLEMLGTDANMTGRREAHLVVFVDTLDLKSATKRSTRLLDLPR